MNTPAYIIAGLVALLVIAGIVTVIVRRRGRARSGKPRPTAGAASARQLTVVAQPGGLLLLMLPGRACPRASPDCAS